MRCDVKYTISTNCIAGHTRYIYTIRSQLLLATFNVFITAEQINNSLYDTLGHKKV